MQCNSKTVGVDHIIQIEMTRVLSRLKWQGTAWETTKWFFYWAGGRE